MNYKKILTLMLSIVLCFSVLAGCNAPGTEKSSVKTKDSADNTVILTYGEDTVSLADFRYYVSVAAMETAYALDPETAKDITTFDWNQKDKDGNVVKDVIIQKALNSALKDSIMIEKAREQGVTLTDEEKKTNIQSIESSRIQTGDEAFLLTANAIGIKDIEGYKDLANRMMSVEKAEKEISENTDKYMVKDIDLSKWKNDDIVTAQHVLITNESETYSDPEATAKEVLEKAKAGEDFAKLIEEYNEDPGATAAGYTFGPGEMVKEFEEAAFALDCDELSEVVQTEHGYHVIHRIAGLPELQNYWVENEKYTINKEVLSQLSVKDIMTEAGNAQKKLQALNATKK